MIEPTRITDQAVDVIDYVESYFHNNKDPLFLHVSYRKDKPHVERVFVITADDRFGAVWTVTVHKAPHINNTPERNFDILQRDFPQFVEWYLFHPEYL